MGDQTDPKELVRQLNRAVPLVARDAVMTAVAAGTLAGPEGVALAATLRDMARDQLADLERLAARVASLGGTPALGFEAPKLPGTWRSAIGRLAKLQRETLDALVAAIPADDDDAEGEATEHLLEHAVTRTRDGIELLERALR
jgi:hypothetical protein